MPDGVLVTLAKALGVGDDDMEVDGVAAGSFEKVRNAVEVVIREGYSAGQLLTQVRPHRAATTR